MIINHAPFITLAYFRARSTWVTCAFKHFKLLKCHLKEKCAGNWQMDRILIILKKNGSGLHLPLYWAYIPYCSNILLVYIADLR